MTAKEYLQQIQLLKVGIDLLEREADRIRNEISGLDPEVLRSPWPDGLPHGTGTGDPVGEAAAKHADKIRKQSEQLRQTLVGLEISILRKRDDMYKARQEVVNTIQQVPDPTLQRLLELRYIECLSWERIAVELHYTFRHTIRLHGDALKEVSRIIRGK